MSISANWVDFKFVDIWMGDLALKWSDWIKDKNQNNNLDEFRGRCGTLIVMQAVKKKTKHSKLCMDSDDQLRAEQS